MNYSGNCLFRRFYFKMAVPTVTATRIVNQAMRLQIPRGLIAGDTFVVTPDSGRIFTVIVPENAIPGSYIEVIVPDEVEASDRKSVV